MLPWYQLLICLVHAKLIFGNLQLSEEDSVMMDFSDNHVEIEGTTVTLENDIVKCELAYQHYLLCFREGQLLYPNSRDEMGKEFEVQVGDLLVWTTFDLQPPTFKYELFPNKEGPSFTFKQLNIDKTYRFEVMKEGSSWQMRVLDRFNSKFPVTCPIASFIVIICTVIFSYLWARVAVKVLLKI